MEEFNRNQRAEAFSKLPQGLKSFIMGDESVTLFQDIGRLHVLNIEKTGALVDVITLTLVGLIPPAQFTSTIQSRLEIDTQKAMAISETVEKVIFLKVRGILQGEPASESGEVVETENPTREDMIAEIENPTPFQHPISADQPNGPGPSNLSVITNASVDLPSSTSIPSSALIPQPPTTNTTVAHEFIASKMNEPVSMPPQKYAADPYREPLV